MAMKTAIAVVGAGAIMTLQGCGGSGGGGDGSSTSSKAPSPDTNSTTASVRTTTTPPRVRTTTTTSSTSTLPYAPTMPLSGAAAAAIMNQEYLDFNKDDSSGSIGTYIRVTGSTEIFCHTSCYNGWADCRVSGSVYNPSQIISSTGTLSWNFGDEPGVGTQTGFWVNQTLIKARLAKCAFIFDGGTDFKYNMGCGCSTIPPAGNCTVPITNGSAQACASDYCPYLELDPATDYTEHVTGESAVVKDCAIGEGSSCTDPGLCAYKGPSFYKETGYIADDTFTMLAWRANNAATATYNELIIDGELMIQELQSNPAGTIPAILYTSEGGDAARAAAQQMALDLQTKWNMDAPVPVIKVDLDVVVTAGNGPFVFEAGEITV